MSHKLLSPKVGLIRELWSKHYWSRHDKLGSLSGRRPNIIEAHADLYSDGDRKWAACDGSKSLGPIAVEVKANVNRRAAVLCCAYLDHHCYPSVVEALTKEGPSQFGRLPLGVSVLGPSFSSLALSRPTSE